MKASKWLIAISGALLLTSSPVLTAQNTSDITYEGYDAESPEVIEAKRREIAELFKDAEVGPLSAGEKAAVLSRYQHLDANKDVPTDLLEKAVLYFDKNKDKFPNQEYITIVDFKPKSDKHRLYLINVATGAVEKYHTSHGTGSDKNKNHYAESFGNVINSGKSSLGFARVSEEYVGKFGRSIRLDGLSTTNSNIRARAVVLHGWDQTYERDVVQGWSWGCITLDYAVRDPFLDKVRGGSLMYSGVSALKTAN